VEAPVPRHDAAHFQLPVEAVKIFLDRASDIMKRNDAITIEDWNWFHQYLDYMRVEVQPGPITK